MSGQGIAKLFRGMLQMRRCRHRSFREISTDRRGIAALEYGLLAAIIAATLIGVLTPFESGVQTLFTDVAAKVTAVGGSAPRPSGD